MFERKRSVHLSYGLSTVALALMVLFGLAFHTLGSPTSADVMRLPEWARIWYRIQNSMIVSYAAVLAGSFGIVIALRMKGTERGDRDRDWFGLYGTTSEFIYGYSLAALLGGFLQLVTRTRLG